MFLKIDCLYKRIYSTTLCFINGNLLSSSICTETVSSRRERWSKKNFNEITIYLPTYVGSIKIHNQCIAGSLCVSIIIRVYFWHAHGMMISLPSKVQKRKVWFSVTTNTPVSCNHMLLILYFYICPDMLICIEPL